MIKITLKIITKEIRREKEEGGRREGGKEDGGRLGWR